MKQRLSTQKIVIAGLLSAIAIVLSVTGLGYIPLPTAAGRATFIHVPVILAGILEGPIIGGFVGFIFGLHSFMTPTGVIPADPIVRILPRILIGIVSFGVYYCLRRWPNFAAGAAAVMGTLTNTVGFLGLAVLMGYMPWPAAATVMVMQMPFEMILAAVLTVILVKALNKQHRD